MQMRIKGKIQVYSSDVNAGTIICEDNQVYLFSRRDWISPEEPEVNLVVVFYVEGNNARSIAVD